MQRYRVEILTDARLQLHDIARIHKNKVGAISAKKVTDRIISAIKKLESFPELGVVPKGDHLSRFGYRMLFVDEYLCFYIKEQDTIYIEQILHGSIDYTKWLLK